MRSDKCEYFDCLKCLCRVYWYQEGMQRYTEERSMIKEYLKKIDEVIENGKYKDTWESLAG